MSQPETTLYRLINSAQKGNTWAARYLNLHLNELDTRELEDSLNALGLSGDAHIETLLTFAKNGVLSPQAFEDIMGDVPLSLGDDLAPQLSFLEHRRMLVEQITGKELEGQKAEALRAIDASLTKIKSRM